MSRLRCSQRNHVYCRFLVELIRALLHKRWRFRNLSDQNFQKKMSEHKETFTGAHGGFRIYNHGFEIYYKMGPSSNAINQKLQTNQLSEEGEQMKKIQPVGPRILKRG